MEIVIPVKYFAHPYRLNVYHVEIKEKKNMSNTITQAKNPNRILLGPGPGMVDPRVLKVLSGQAVGHLDPELLKVMNEIQILLRLVFETKNEVTSPSPAPVRQPWKPPLSTVSSPAIPFWLVSSGILGTGWLKWHGSMAQM